MGKGHDGHETCQWSAHLSGCQLHLAPAYGQVLPYAPADGVKYDYYTTLKGAMEKEDPDNWEFVVPAN